MAEKREVSGPEVTRIFRDEKFASRPLREQIAELYDLRSRAADESVRNLIFRKIESLKEV